MTDFSPLVTNVQHKSFMKENQSNCDKSYFSIRASFVFVLAQLHNQQMHDPLTRNVANFQLSLKRLEVS